ncbi:MAG: hypothetical protein LW690_05725 [Opitutaceae bacterium]|jgi:hypothetical protein|nr:hypothetical protein [Opitutaceae bacterium]
MKFPCVALLLLLLGGICPARSAAPSNPSPAVRPRLQIINGSAQSVDIFWLKSDTERVPSGSIAPSANTVITTTLGHRFAVVGRDDRTERVVTSLVPVQGFRFDPPDEAGVPAFYTQRVSAGGFPIVASAQVNPYALKEAAYLVDLMLAKRPDVRAAMIQSGARLSILAWNEFTCDQPEWKWLAATPVPDFPAVPARDYRDARARGMGGSLTDPFCSCAEENLLAYTGDPYSQENILIHEFAHNMHLRGLSNVDPTFDARVKQAYDSAMKAGRWKGKYASVNHHEYFAEGVQSWFDDNRENDHDHNHVNTRAELLAYDPGLAALCREVFGDTELRYTKPTTRLTGHLAGYDPAKAPTFVWPERLAKLKAQIRQQAQARSDAANATPRPVESSSKPKPAGAVRFNPVVRDIEGWKVHLEPALVDGEHGELGAKARAMLANHLQRIKILIPAGPLAKMQRLEIWLEHSHPTLKAKQYHPSRDWLVANGHDPRLVRKVHLPQARDLLSREQMLKHPAVILHELAHAYHDQVLGFDHPEILAAYDKAKAAGNYEEVLAHTGRRVRHYGLANHKEYFAEGTEAFFYRNDFYPFVRAELKEHDPALENLLMKIWEPAK